MFDWVECTGCAGPTEFSSPLSEAGTAPFDPRLIGTWVGSEGGALQIFQIERSARPSESQLQISFSILSRGGFVLSANADEVAGNIYYSVKPDLASYFRNWNVSGLASPEPPTKVPGYLIVRVEFIKDNEVAVWLAYPRDGCSLARLAGRAQDSYCFVTASPEQLRALLSDNPIRVLNVRKGPYVRLTQSIPVEATEWLIDERSGCAVGMRGRSFPAPDPSNVTWSGDCVDGKASGHGLVEWWVTVDQDRTLLEAFEGTLIGGLPHGSGRCRLLKSEEWIECRYAEGKRLSLRAGSPG